MQPGLTTEQTIDIPTESLGPLELEGRIVRAYVVIDRPLNDDEKARRRTHAREVLEMQLQSVTDSIERFKANRAEADRLQPGYERARDRYIERLKELNDQTGGE